MIKRLCITLVFYCTANLMMAQSFNGPLKVSTQNPRYFTNGNGKAILLTGSHTWENLQDILAAGDKPFDYSKYIGMMQANGHNFMRLWMFEQPRMAAWTADSITMSPLPFSRTGPGLANDGKPKFDLKKYNPDYFNRLRNRVIQAGKKNIYVSVMLFQGWSLDRTNFRIGDPFPFLPYNKDNNINNIDAPESNEDFDDKPSLHSLMISPQLLAVQEAYVKKVIETVNDLDNVLYEIINEGGGTDWQYHIINFIKKTEAAMPKQHPVGMTHRGDPKQPNQVLFDSPADWISPNAKPYDWYIGDSVINSSFKTNPPASTGKKVVVTDTDHLWGHGGNHQWVWKSFLRGLNPIFMDPLEPLPGREDEERSEGWIYITGGITKDDPNYPDYDLIRKSMGYARSYAARVNLMNMIPHAELSTTQYCLADIGKEYLIYFPGTTGTIDLHKAAGEYTVEWFIPVLNKKLVGPKALKGGKKVFVEPPTALDALLYLKRK